MTEPCYVYNAYVDRVIDGDTYVLDVDLGFRCHVQIEARLHGVNSPELNTPEGKAAKAFVDHLMLDAAVLVKSYKDQRSFARWVCDVFVNGESLADILKREGHAT